MSILTLNVRVAMLSAVVLPPIDNFTTGCRRSFLEMSWAT
jgi:hypothetical protein